MNGRRAIVGLCMLCALLVSAFTAQGASAEGTTAYTCVENATDTSDDFTNEHCTPGTSGGKFGHDAIAVDTTTELTGGQGTAFEDTRLQAVISGVETELKATGVSGTGTMENGEEGEMFAHGEGTINYTGVTVLKPAGKGCKVYADAALTEEGKVNTNTLTATTLGQGMTLKFTPVGARFATFWIAGCEIAALNGEYPVTGSAIGEPNGAETKFSFAETTKTLKIKNAFTKAGIQGALTLEGRANSKEEFTPLSATTTNEMN